MKRIVKSAALAAALLLVAAINARADAPRAGTFDWTGVYVGVNAGAAYAHERWNFPGPGDNGTNANSNVLGAMVGGTLGWNFVQTGRWVFGAEGDADWTNLDSHAACPNPQFPICKVKISNFSTVRGRAGYAVRDRLLVFATAGVAGGEVSPSANGISPVQSTSKMAWGYTVGAGVEYALCDHRGGAWTAKLEYLYADLGDNQYVNSGSELDNIRTQIHVVRAGLNFKF